MKEDYNNNHETKKILLLKVPDAIYPGGRKTDDFSKKHTYYFFPSYALAALSAYMIKYLKIKYELKVVDVNFLAVSLGSKAISKLYDYMKEIIKKNKFDILLISGQFMSNQRWVMAAVDLAHKIHPQAKIVVGGGFSTIFPEKMISAPGVDYVVVGEGEHTIINIINKICNFKDSDFEAKHPFEGYAEKFSNGSYKMVEKKSFIFNLEELPRPNWDWLDLEEYKKHSSSPFLPFMATRGCPYNCNYCSTKLSWGLRLRCRTVGDVVEEILWNYRKHGIKIFRCVDDNIIFDKKWFREFCRRLISLPKDITYNFYHFSVRQIDEEILDALRSINVKAITIAVESGDGDTQKAINKNLNLAEVEEKVKLIKQKGFRVNAYWMIGFPNETMRQIMNTVDMARSLRTDTVAVWKVFPYPGTKLYNDAKAQNLINLDEDDYESMSYQDSGKIFSNEWDGEKLSQIAYDANIELNFLNTPLYESKSGREELMSLLVDLTRRINGHVIAYIILGFLADKFFGDQLEKDKEYRTAYNILKEGSPTFERYLAWNFPQIIEFKKWAAENNLKFTKKTAN